MQKSKEHSSGNRKQPGASDATDIAASSPQAFAFGTKAETLARLKPLVSRAKVAELVYFTVADWRQDKAAILRRLHREFGKVTLAVRSSARGEDSIEGSAAGVYRSRLSVNGADAEEVAEAIEEVIASYSGDPRDQVLVQPMLQGIAASGVIMTHDVSRGSPYYIVNFDDVTGSSSSVTSGRGAHKLVFVHRGAPRSLIRSDRVVRFVELAEELESHCGSVPLDIEFALLEDGRLYLLQARPISLHANWHPSTERRVARQLSVIQHFLEQRSLPRPGIAGSRTILGVMPDWNPAEIIGIEPRPLAASLYQELVTREVWRRARQAMGYARLPGEDLMVLVGGRPYIDVRNSFNSFLPEGLAPATRQALVDAWLDRLDANPELHDKVEFEIVPTCRDFTFDAAFRERYGALLAPAALADYRERLTAVTRECLRPGAAGSLAAAQEMIAALQERQDKQRAMPALDAYALLVRACSLIEECRQLGTYAFAILARHAFIAEALLRSAAQRGALRDERLSQFKRGLQTITSRFAGDYVRACGGKMPKEEFLAAYGHLRPGTYDITSLRYDERGDSLFDGEPAAGRPADPPFALSEKERRELGLLLQEAGFPDLSADGLLDYSRLAMCGREHGKFVFTRNLSDALQAIAEWGKRAGLDREDLSFIEWPRMARAICDAGTDALDRVLLEEADRGRRVANDFAALKLGYLLREPDDVYVATLHKSTPTFIGGGKVEGPVARLEPNTPLNKAIFGKIVCVENADPGFDWIFAKGIRGLVTKFGGANSHMAIRCAELGVPAAIGCGEQAFRRLLDAGLVELNCAEKVVGPLHGR
jgi:phosphohistidine swiveling domain-containing protein